MQSDSSAQQVKDKLPIEEVVGGYVKLERAGRSLRARCPFHTERTASFYVSPERGTYYCFGCGEKGDVFSFVEKMDGVGFREALIKLAERAGVVLAEYKGGEKGPSQDERERLFALHEDATVFFQEGIRARADVGAYLESRGLTAETVEKWRVGYAPAQWRALTEAMRARGYRDEELIAAGLSIKAEKEGSSTVYDRFRGRIMFPIGDVGGRIIAFSGRHFEQMHGGSEKKEEPAKYMNSPETPLFRKSKVLYGLNRAKDAMRKNNFAIVVEGQMDLLMMHQCGFPNAVAGSGTALTEEHMRTIGHLTKRLLLALDGDTAGIKSALRTTGLAFAEGLDVRIASFPEGKDPADMGKESPEALRGAIREAKVAVEFFIAHARTRGRDERAVRRLAEEEVVPLIAQMRSTMDQAHFVQVAARALDLPEESVRASVKTSMQSRKFEATATVGTPPPRVPSLSAFESACVHIFHTADPHAHDRLLSTLGDVRFEAMKQLAEERLEHKQAQGLEYSIEELFKTIDKELLSEEIATTRRALKEAEEGKRSTEIERLSSALRDLTRRRDGLEK